MKIKITLLVLSAFLTGCGVAEKELVPPAPENAIKDRTENDLRRKLTSIRQPIQGDALSTQRRESSSDINSILQDGAKYKNNMYLLYKKNPYIEKKQKTIKSTKQYTKKTNNKKGISDDKENNRLRFY